MRLRRYCWVACLAFLIVFRGEAFAAAVPAYSGKMNTAVGGVISQKMSKWGFAANDPRFGATMTGVGTGVTTFIVGGLGVAVGAATWPAVLVGAGVTALVSGAVAWGQDSIYKWLFNSDGSVTTQGSPSSGGGGSGSAMIAGGSYFESNGYYGASGDDVAKAAEYAAWGTYGVVNGGRIGDDGNYWYYIDWVDSPQGHCAPSAHCSSRVILRQSSGAPASCSAGQVYYSGSCGAVPGSAPPTTDLTNATPSAAVAAMPDSELAKPISNELLAAAANAAWKQMAASTPNALPWSATDPITPADVSDWKAANPSSIPTVGDAIGPVASPGSTAVPIAQPGAQPSTGPAATPGSGTQVDLGPNPNTPPPGLETTPTAQQIMNPVLNVMPDLKNFAVPSHSAQCPTGSFGWNGKTYTIDAQCQLIENNRSVIEAALLLVWTIVALFIILGA